MPNAALCLGHQLQNLSTDHHSNQFFPLPFLPSCFPFPCHTIGFLLFLHCLVHYSYSLHPSFLCSKVKRYSKPIIHIPLFCYITHHITTISSRFPLCTRSTVEASMTLWWVRRPRPYLNRSYPPTADAAAAQTRFPLYCNAPYIPSTTTPTPPSLHRPSLLPSTVRPDEGRTTRSSLWIVVPCFL